MHWAVIEFMCDIFHAILSLHPNLTQIILDFFWTEIQLPVMDISRGFVSMPKGWFWLKLWCNCCYNWPHTEKLRNLSHRSICSFCAPGCCFQAWLATWEEYKNIVRVRRAVVRKANVHLELNLAWDAKDSKKGFFKHISSRRKTRENVGPLLN